MIGTPGKGIHSYRLPFIDVAAFDTIATVMCAYILTEYEYVSLSFNVTLVILFALAVVAHRVFRARTTIDRILFP